MKDFDKFAHDFNVWVNQAADNAEALANMGEKIGHLDKLYTEYFTGMKRELVTIRNFGEPFRAEGYRLNSVYVSDADAANNPALTVTIDGLSYTVNLAAGENAVNIPDGAELKVSKALTVLFTRYNMAR